QARGRDRRLQILRRRHRDRRRRVRLDEEHEDDGHHVHHRGDVELLDFAFGRALVPALARQRLAVAHALPVVFVDLDRLGLAGGHQYEARVTSGKSSLWSLGVSRVASIVPITSSYLVSGSAARISFDSSGNAVLTSFILLVSAA